VLGAAVLDLFAGTGGLGLEAASRGARSVVFVENDRNALECLRRNVESARRWPGMECELEVVKSDVFVEVKHGAGSYDLILADPPYGELPQRLLDEIGASKLLAAGGLLVLEAGKRDSLAVPAGWRAERDAVYGDTRVCFVGRVS
jgi:16S rRNA (guanine966-N2)-methyltransferase